MKQPQPGGQAEVENPLLATQTCASARLASRQRLMHDVAPFHRSSSLLRALLVLCGLAVSTQGRAQPVCEAPFVRIESPLPSEWQAAVGAACQHVAGLSEIDRAVTVRIEYRDPLLRLEARRSDGRSTERSVDQPSELLTTLEALVMMPPTAAPAIVSSEPRTGSTGPQRAQTPRASVHDPIHVEFGAEVSGRLAWKPTYLSPALGLHIGLRLDGWMFGIDARSEPYQFPVGRPSDGFEMDGFGVGIFLNRRVFDGPVGLDVGVRAFLGEENQALEVDELANQASVVDVRAGALVRLLIGRESPRWTIALDAELSPMRLRREFKIYQYLPGASIGLGFGVALESP